MPCFGMPQELKVLAIIPARKGSKRLPGKNTMMFRGKPLVQWSIEQAKEAKYVSQVVVTSDDDKVLELAIRNHCDAIVRPFQLAADATPMNVVVEHVLSLYTCDYVVLLQPTSPLRWCLDIDRCIEKSWAHGKPVVSM
jgi:CMP-N,N'-diacetyllegionaminic acid synthase